MSSLLAALLLVLPADSTPTDSARAESVQPPSSVAVTPAGATRERVELPAVLPAVAPALAVDGGQPAIEYSDWYGRRLTIHRVASYTTLPLFAFQYAAGRRLYDESTDAPGWAKTGHGIAATGIAALFGVNTVTGVWNLWDARKDPEGRTRRTVHAVLMLAADAGFTATGILAETAERDADARSTHRTIALGSVAVATTSYLMMIPPFRRD